MSRGPWNCSHGKGFVYENADGSPVYDIDSAFESDSESRSEEDGAEWQPSAPRRAQSPIPREGAPSLRAQSPLPLDSSLSREALGYDTILCRDFTLPI